MKIFPGFGLVGGGSVGSAAVVAALAGQAIGVSRITVTGGTITANAPNEISQTWNNAGVVFKGLRTVITNSASGAGSLVYEIVVNGSTIHSIDPLGVARFSGNELYVGGSVHYFRDLQSAFPKFLNGSVNSVIIFGQASDGTRGLFLTSNSTEGFGFLSGNYNNGVDLYFTRDAADTLAQRRGTNPQISRVYASFTDLSNYERSVLQFEGSGSSRASVRRNEAAGTGTLRPYIPVTGSFTVSNLPSASTIGAGARSMVTDANATTFQSIVAGGGSNVVPVYSDGTDWRIG